MKFGKQRKLHPHNIDRSRNKIESTNSELGINLSGLSEAQKKKCVKLLAQGNVQFIEKQNNFVATLRVPTQKLEELSHKNQKNAKSSFLEREKSMGISIGAKKEMGRQKSPGKAKMKKQQGYHDGKKPLRKVVKMGNIEILQEIYPQVDIYIYPKRISFNTLIQIIENSYHMYWNLHQNDSMSGKVSKSIEKSTNRGPDNRFQKVFFEVLENSNQVFNRNTKNPKIDQHLVNVLDTIYHFQFKSLGVKVFASILIGEVSYDTLNYFLILRALLENIMGENILDDRSSYKTRSFSFKSGKASNNSYLNHSFMNSFLKLKWSPYEIDIEQPQVKEFLRISLITEQEFNPMFEKLTKLMYFDELRRNNFIPYFELINFMLSQFNSQVNHENINLDLSYSRDSTLHQILFSETNRQHSDPLQTLYVQKIQPITPNLATEYLQRNSNFVQEINLLYTEKCREIANKMLITTLIFREKIEPKMLKCLEAIICSNRQLWIDTTKIEGKESELLYIENLQRDFEKFKEQIGSANLVNAFIKRIIYGPGVMNIFIEATKF